MAEGKTPEQNPGELFSNTSKEVTTPKEDKVKDKSPNSQTTIIVKEKDEKISQAFGGYTPEQIAVIRGSVAKGCSGTELSYFLNVCKTMQLNPFNKEVWAYKDNRGNLLIFAGRDGFLSKAQQNKLFGGIRSAEICQEDEFEIDVPNGEVKHKVKAFGKARGPILGAYAIVFRKEGEPTVEFADFATYNKGFNAWKTHPAEMIKKVAESHALKKAFGISGIQSEYDFNVKDGVARPITQGATQTAEVV